MMKNDLNTPSTRLTVVDALRGFALVSIMLLHNIEKFEVYRAAENLPAWIAGLDAAIWDSFFFIFGGKSYAIFALLFGLTFFIQTNNQEKRGEDFRPRFLWRLILLLGFGVINTLFYQGEILILYALVGVLLVPFAKMSNRAILISACILLFQPILWASAIAAIQNPSAVVGEPMFMTYYHRVGDVLCNGSMFDVMKSNITNGRTASLLWYWENDRVSQTLGLFLLGFLAGRKEIFSISESNRKIWKEIFLGGAGLFILFYTLKLNLGSIIHVENILKSIEAIVGMWSNLAFTAILVSGFVLLYYMKSAKPVLDKLSPIGRMSLSNYIIQSMVGSFIYYGYGLGMYQHLGSTYCLIVGIVLAFVQLKFSTFWFSNHKRGPLEWVWNRLTWIGKKSK